ncbi:MAG: hypothetical protein PHC52_13925 [Syntrophales bacterium]|nr:hypothetical protein [Candidatus ainarchaeum sp.]MDD5533888.1 hypothetical protein [Syntrophales bacterium]
MDNDRQKLTTSQSIAITIAAIAAGAGITAAVSSNWERIWERISSFFYREEAASVEAQEPDESAREERPAPPAQPEEQAADAASEAQGETAGTPALPTADDGGHRGPRVVPDLGEQPSPHPVGIAIVGDDGEIRRMSMSDLQSSSRETSPRTGTSRETPPATQARREEQGSRNSTRLDDDAETGSGLYYNGIAYCVYDPFRPTVSCGLYRDYRYLETAHCTMRTPEDWICGPMGPNHGYDDIKWVDRRGVRGFIQTPSRTAREDARKRIRQRGGY